MKKIIVQKFGGSSVKDKLLRNKVVNHIIKVKKENKTPVVVVSAMGKDEGPYSTDKLIELIKEENENVSNRELDQIMSCGEIISSAVLAARIQKEGFFAVSLTGFQAGIKTYGEYGGSEIVEIDTSNIKKHIQENNIVVVAGFQGISCNGDITTTGRGGSDTTAAAIGAFLKADRVEIYTDVDGLMTADPKVVPKAAPIESITYYEILQMAREGAKIIHPRAVYIAMKYGLPLIIKNTSNENQGTKVISSVEPANKNANGGCYKYHKNQIIGITHYSHLVQIHVDFNNHNREQDKIEVIENIILTRTKFKMLDILENKIVFVIPGIEFEKTIKELEARGIGKINYRKDCAKINLPHGGIDDNSFIAAKALKVLTGENISILQTSDSSISTSFLIQQKNLEKGLKLLHEEFFNL